MHVFYGQPTGLAVDASGSALDDQYLSQHTPGVPGAAEAGDAFGTAEAGDAFGTTTLLADLNGDGCADLVVGSPGERGRVGAVQVFSGSPGGLRTSGVQGLALTDLPGSPTGAIDQGFGAALAAGDLDGDGIADLVVGAPGVAVAGLQYAGAVAVAYGSRAGLDLGRSLVITRDSSGVRGDPEEYENFGTAVVTGDFDGDGRTELAVGSGSGSGGGAVQVLARTGTGFTGAPPIIPSSAGLPGDADRFCDFGSVLAVGDVQGDGRDDLAVGDPQFGCRDEETEDGMGAVVLMSGSPSGLTTDRAQLWTQDSPGVTGTARLGDVFGDSLTMAPLDRDDTADLVIGATYDGVGGSVTVLLGSPTGLTTKGIGGTRYTQATAGIPGTDESADWFGQSVIATFAQSRTQATIVIAAPGEDVGRIRDAGSITVIPVGAHGPRPSAARTLTADTRGVKGQAQPGDYFGGAGGVWG